MRREGTIKYEKLAIAEKKLEPIKFPVSIEIPGQIPIPVPRAKPAAEKDCDSRGAKVENRGACQSGLSSELRSSGHS